MYARTVSTNRPPQPCTGLRCLRTSALQRVELIKLGRDDTTLVRIVQGPYEAAEAGYHTQGWEREFNRLETFLAEHPVEGAAR